MLYIIIIMRYIESLNGEDFIYHLF